MNEINEALTCFRRVLSLKPDYALAHSNLGLALQELGKLDDAASTFREAVRIKPDFAEAYSNLGTVSYTHLTLPTIYSV